MVFDNTVRFECDEWGCATFQSYHVPENSPVYLRQNEHFKFWDNWLRGGAVVEGSVGISDIRFRDDGKRKIGTILWTLKNHPFPYWYSDYCTENNQEVYDPAIRDSGVIRGYNPTTQDRWHVIYLNEAERPEVPGDPDEPGKVYPFYMNLFKLVWGTN